MLILTHTFSTRRSLTLTTFTITLGPRRLEWLGNAPIVVDNVLA